MTDYVWKIKNEIALKYEKIVEEEGIKGMMMVGSEDCSSMAIDSSFSGETSGEGGIANGRLSERSRRYCLRSSKSSAAQGVANVLRHFKVSSVLSKPSKASKLAKPIAKKDSKPQQRKRDLKKN